MQARPRNFPKPFRGWALAAHARDTRAVARASTGSLIGGWSVLWDVEKGAHVREIRRVLHYGSSWKADRERGRRTVTTLVPLDLIPTSSGNKVPGTPRYLNGREADLLVTVPGTDISVCYALYV